MDNFQKFSQVETFRNFPYNVRASFFTCLFFTLYVSGYFLPYYLCFYSIVYVSGNFPEIVITRQREKATRGIDLDTQHDLLETNRTGPKLRELGPARPGLTRQQNWNCQARPGPFSALVLPLTVRGLISLPFASLVVLYIFT
jgi:hypothetical protein